jgi:predicted Rossmann fold nucleotide-binding protein DprA/Smf involved in DNA uptake
VDKELSHRQFALLLSLTPYLGQKGIERILRQNAVAGYSAEEFLALSADRKKHEYGLLAAAANALTVGLKDLLDELTRFEARVRAAGVEILTLQDAAYPSRLVNCIEEPPALLFTYGNQQLLSQSTFCALTSRKPTKLGLANIEVVVERMVFEHKVLVSGHNTDGYKRASVTGLRWGAPRILALDCGLFAGLGDNLTNEPFRVARLYRYQFDPKTDLVISPFRPSDRYIGNNNQLRDELIVALSDQVVAVEIRSEGQMERLGLQALSQGRSVYACEYPNYDYDNQGNQSLLEHGALPFV